jgi:hypothetical protein
MSFYELAVSLKMSVLLEIIFSKYYYIKSIFSEQIKKEKEISIRMKF